MGVPVVSYDIDGVDQLITHNITGLLAPLKDKAALEACMLRAIDEPEQMQTLANAAIAYVNEHYAASRMAREYLDLFHRLAKR